MKKSRITLANFMIYILFMIGSSYTLYISYTQHHALKSRLEQVAVEKNEVAIDNLNKSLLEEKTLMAVSFLILLLSIFLSIPQKSISSKKERKREDESLKKLLLEIENYSEFKDRVEDFKEVVAQKNTPELHLLISKMMEELHEIKELADDANRTKSLFLANMSHEIRTPLNGIVGFTKFLNSTELDGEQKEFIHLIRNSSEDLINMVNDILDVSKIESGNIELKEDTFSPVEAFESLIETYRVIDSKKSIDFSIWIDPMLSTKQLRGDVTKIKQVLINLISNAFKFTESHGEIDVRIEVLENGSSDTNKERIKFSVKDTGIGIGKEQKDKIFDLFTQADNSATKKYAGVGLGLTISSKLVKLLGGFLVLESEVDKGTTFSFTLELAVESVTPRVELDTRRIAIFAPKELEIKYSNRYLEDYLKAYKNISTIRFNKFEACLNNKIPFDALFIHCVDITKDVLNKLIGKYQNQTQIVLVTQLNQRDVLVDLSKNFSSVIYEPISFSKVDKSIKGIVERERQRSKPKEIKVEKVSREMGYKGMKSLVVDDNLINQKMMVHTLKGLGISSDVAENGKIGLDMRIKNKYDMVFMDIQMPVMNGVEATQAILEYEEERGVQHIPIIAVTANALKGDRERFLKEGLDDYISKPIQLNKLTEVLDKYFQPQDRVETVVVKGTDILLFKETSMESKIIGAILEKMGYSVEVAKTIEELKESIDKGAYRSILLDRIRSDIEYRNVTEKIVSQKRPTLLFVENRDEVSSSELDNYTYVVNKVTDYADIKSKLDSMMDLSMVDTAVA